MSRMCLGMNPKNFSRPSESNHPPRASAKAIRFPVWEAEFGRRWEQYLEWRHIAVQVIQRAGGSFRIIAILDEVFDLAAGECWATDDEFARASGGCSTKTASRDIAHMKALGLFIADSGWRMKAGKNVRARRLRLSVPIDISGIHIR